jgi:spermidine/putrescine transport system ATP-binding protein
MSVSENVAYPLRRLKHSRDRIAGEVGEILDMVRLGSLSKRMPSELSGGQAQRVALARALVSRPAVLLLDEPLSALDLTLRKEMQLELRRLQDLLGTTFIFVTHDQEEALTMSSRIVVMHDGHVVQVGTPRDIYDSPESVFASTFIGETNLLRGTILECSDGIATIQVADHRVRAVEPRSLVAGTAVALSVRPERIRLTPPESAAEGWNSLPGTVVELVFLGNRIRARLDCAGTAVWVQKDAATIENDQLVESSRTTVWWPFADGRVLLPETP